MNVGRIQHALQGPRPDAELDAADYLRQLCESRRTSIEPAHLQFLGHSVRLDAARCRRLGMIVSELVENARKHAFAGAPGLISVELGVVDRKVHCRVADNGRGYAGTHRSGRGLRIVCELAKSLNGNIAQEPVKTGTAWLLTIPH